MSLIEAERITKVYASSSSTLLALDEVSFDIRPGEFVSLVGPSGCGKSTLLNIIGGLHDHSSGQLTFRGEPLTKPRADIGMMFQTPVLFPWRTVAQNVMLPGRVLRRDRRMQEQRCAELLELVGLAGFENRYPNELSGGMRQRAALARLLAYDPEVLLMDEPFGALDEFTRETLDLELLRVWATTGKTVVFVTHNISEAVFLSDRVFVMTPRPGRLEAIVDVDLPRPRDREILNNQRFHDIVLDIRRIFGVAD